MSFSGDRLEHLTRNDVTDLCRRLSSVCDENADDAREDKTSLKLGCLTTCHQWFRSKQQPANLNNFYETYARLIHLVIDLIQTDADPFVLYAARRALVVLLDHHRSKAEFKGCFHEILDCLGNKEIGTSNKATVLEITSDLLQGELAITVLDVLKQRFPWIVENVLKIPFHKDNSILRTTFLILWRKSAKKCQDLQLDLCWVMEYETLLQTLHRISGNEKHIYSRQVIHLLKTFYCYGRILCLQTSVQPIYVRLGTAILQWALERGIANLHDESASGFGGKLILISCNSRIKTEFGDLSSLRQLAALLLSVAATIVRFSQNTEVNPALLELSECLSQLNDHATLTVQGSDHSSQPFDWMTSAFGDQDDTLMEALLEVLDIYCITKKRLDTLGPYLEKLTATINPHREFYLLLQMTGFDHSVLIDLLTSPETCALLYLTRYLKCVINEWDIFLETLDSLGDRKTVSISEHRKCDPGCLTKDQGTDSTDNSHEDVTKSFVVSYKQSKQNCADDERRTADVEEQMTACSSQDNPAPEESVIYGPRVMECSRGESQFVTDLMSSANAEGQSVMECVSGTEHHPELVTDSSIESESNPEIEWLTSGTGTSVTLGSPGLALLGQYSDDSDSDDSFPGHIPIDKSGTDSSQIVTQMETMEIEPSLLGEDSQCRNQVSDRTKRSEPAEGTEICDNKLKVNKCLDETMATLIRLRLKMESLCEGGLLVYHPGPLVRLLAQCEALYEQ